MDSGHLSKVLAFEEAADFLMLPYQALESDRAWTGPVKEDVLLCVTELRFYRLMAPVREMYLEMVDELLGLGTHKDGLRLHQFERVAEKYFGRVTFQDETGRVYANALTLL